MKDNFLRPFAAAAAFLSASCTTTHVQWDAVKMREQVTDYYQDEIMDNLIRGRNGEMFVHVDVTGLSALAGSKLAATVGDGETIARTHGPTVVGSMIVNTLTKVVTTPFSASIAPERSNTLTITSTPVIGKAGGKNTENIYDLYLSFLNLKPGQSLVESRPDHLYSYVGDSCQSVKIARSREEESSLREGVTVVPHTLKRGRDRRLYYVPIEFRAAYLELCRQILTRDRPASPTPPQSPAVLVN